MRAQGSDFDLENDEEIESASRFSAMPRPDRRTAQSPRFAKARRPAVSSARGIHRRRNKKFYC